MVLFSLPAVAQEQKLTASDGQASDFFGASVAISGDIAIVGASGDDDTAEDAGSAYIFERIGGTWVEQQKLTASDGQTEDHFGAGVAISGDVAILSAVGDDDLGSLAGSAYVFERVGGTWVEQQKLTASDGEAQDEFGISIAISGDIAFIGARDDDDNGFASGSAYVFERVGGTWVEQQKLTASDGQTRDYFGGEVAISGNVAVVGAWLDDDNAEDAGSAYIFERIGGTWVEQQKLTASDGDVDDYFGNLIAISGDVIVIGARLDDDNGNASGSAYIFERIGGTWVEQQKLTASDGQAGDFFGISVSISGNLAMIGAHGDDDLGNFSGAVYVFEQVNGVWNERQKLFASDGQAGDQFGGSVVISDDIAIVGAAADDDNGSSSGSAYVFSLPVTRFVAPTGSDTGNNCIDSLNPCATLMYAIEQAKDSDTIDLAAGTYNEPGLIIDKVLSMRGQW